jgi:pyruvate kinase
MCLVRGAYGILLGREPHADRLFIDMERILIKKGFVKPGMTVVYTSGIPAIVAETTNTIHVRIALASKKKNTVE